MFVDEAVIHCLAGHGGKGCNSMDRSRPGHFRATGGDGGPGGSIILEARANIHTLLDFQMNRYFPAKNGGHGSSSNKTGRGAEDRVIGVPPGTEVYDEGTGELLRDLAAVGERVTVCRGGGGGKGNDKKNVAGEGEPGEEKNIQLHLKLIADVGLVGFPNAGKSTFISRVSNARSKVAAYPFTTKSPVLGVVKFDEGESRVIADIPGIIEGAHEGRGMGLDFLKHVERTKMLLHFIDFAGVDGRDPFTDYQVMNQELKGYSAGAGLVPAQGRPQGSPLHEKEQIIVANKMDLPEARENLTRFKKKIKKEIYPISAVTGEGVDKLLKRIRRGPES